jgi:hypothetical protein
MYQFYTYGSKDTITAGLLANKYLQNKCLLFKIGFRNFAPLNLILP